MLSNINSYIKQVKSTHDDDSIDRLNYVYTIYLLLGFAVTIFAKNYVGEPLQCWVPKQWTGVWESFSESYCFVENTYFVPMNDTNLPAIKTRDSKEMIYYQWVPFILTLMAVFFYLPRGVWKVFSHYSGLALSDMMSAARTSAKTFKQNEKIKILAAKMRTHATLPQPRSSLRYGSSLFNLYMIMKVLIWCNLILQFFFLNHFLGTGYVLWGFGILSDLINGRHWQQSGHFPRVAFCDLTVREMGNVNNWTVQCVLMVNMFNEKIFLLIWWWMAAVLIMTSWNVVEWVNKRINASNRRRFIATLVTFAQIEDADEHQKEDFYTNVLKDDGVLVLRLLDSNGGRMQSSDLVKTLWDLKFGEEERESEASSPTSVSDEKKPLLGKILGSRDSLELSLHPELWGENYPS